MFSSFADVSPHMLGIFMLALACIPLIFVWHDSKRRHGDRQRLALLRGEARLTAQLRASSNAAPSAVVQNWASEARR